MQPSNKVGSLHQIRARFANQHWSLLSGGVPIKPTIERRGWSTRGWNGHADGASLRCCHNALNDQIHRGGRIEQSRGDFDICVGDFVISYTDVVGYGVTYLSPGRARGGE
jgi:hypothetical protein